MNDTNNQLSNELNQFQNIWHGATLQVIPIKEIKKG